MSYHTLVSVSSLAQASDEGFARNGAANVHRCFGRSVASRNVSISNDTKVQSIRFVSGPNVIAP